MRVSRRDCLRIGALAGVGATLGGCGGLAHRVAGRKLPKDLSIPEAPEPEVRLLNRIAFGAVPGDLERIRRIGQEAYVEEQLAAPSPPDPIWDDGDDPYLRFQIARLDVFRVDAAELEDLPEDTVLTQLQQAAILRAVYSKHQLRERMVDFWTNHFNIYAKKGKGTYRKGADELNVVREHALGKFPDMVLASAKSAAMLAYLDNDVNQAGVPNENYARELMELHTLGVHGGYTQRDVMEVARCLTGWTIENRFLRPHGKFRFDGDVHDEEAKKVLGHKIPAGGGVEDGEKVIEILSRHPSTARFISRKICRYFLGDAGAQMEEAMAKTYLETGGDIKAMLRPMLQGPEILSGPPIVKRPFDYLASSLRALNAETDGGKPLQAHLERMGQPLHQWPMPDGYPDKTSAWTGSLLARWNFAAALCGGEIAGASVPFAEIADRTKDQRAALISLVAAAAPGSPAFEKAEKAIRRAGATDERLTAALCLAAPEFQWR